MLDTLIKLIERYDIMCTGNPKEKEEEGKKPIKKEDKEPKKKDSKNSTVYELASLEKHDVAFAVIKRDYPGVEEKGINKEADMIIAVISGSGKLWTDSLSQTLNVGSIIKIPKGTYYQFQPETELYMYITCSPPWSPEQYETVKI